jgi:hypothetical protein
MALADVEGISQEASREVVEGRLDVDPLGRTDARRTGPNLTRRPPEDGAACHRPASALSEHIR